jgi:hypothetical protein
MLSDGAKKTAARVGDGETGIGAGAVMLGTRSGRCVD